MIKLKLFAIVLFSFSTLSGVQNPAPQQVPASSIQTEELDRDLGDLRYAELEEQLKTMPEGTERGYFEGILANRAGQMEKSARLLEDALPHLNLNQRRRKALGIAALADDYLKLFRYKTATQQYSILLNEYPRDIDPAALDGIRDDFGIIQLIADYPPQQIERTGPTRIKTFHSPLGTIDTTLTVNGVQSPWILDTGANFSLVTASLAKQLGVKPSEKTAQTKGGTNGLENTLRVGLLPKLTLGGATIRNIVVLIFEDRDMKITYGPNMSYQIKAVLGYPVFQMLGSATFTADGNFIAGLPDKDAGAFSRVFMNKLTPLVESTVDGRKLLFAFDTGASGSEFTKRYYDAFPSQFRILKPASINDGGAGGVKKQQVYVLPQVTIQIGGQKVVLHKVPVMPSLLGTEIDDSYGNLGRDITAAFESFTVDFSNMRFSLGKPLSTQ
ncbi:MAG: pepsin/retropepsin-like aspartic protease family protein [Bryobacteraceae bacterium]